MAETDWLGMLGGLVGSAAGAYAGTYAGNPQWGAQVGGAMGQSLGSATSQETGLTEGAGYDPNSMYGSYMSSMGGGGGGGMGGSMGGLMSMFGGGGGGGGGVGGSPIYGAPMMSTVDAFGIAGSMLPGIAQASSNYNLALQPGYTQSQLNAEQQIAPGTFGLRELAMQRQREQLERGWRLPPDMERLLADRAADTLGMSGANASNLGQMFGLRSLAGAGLAQENENLANSFARSQFNPSYFQPRDPFGTTPGLMAALDLRGAEATQNNLMNLNAATQAAASQKQSADFTNKLLYAAGNMKAAGGASGMGSSTGGSAIGGPNYGIGGASGGGSSLGGSGSVWTQSFNMGA